MRRILGWQGVTYTHWGWASITQILCMRMHHREKLQSPPEALTMHSAECLARGTQVEQRDWGPRVRQEHVAEAP